MKIRQAIEAIEARRDSRVLVFAASNLEIEFLPVLYDVLRQIGRSGRLDVLVYFRGGVVNAARRIALLLHQFTDRLTFIVPDRCESSGTIAALAAHEVIAGPVAVFSPVDPLLQGPPSTSGERPLAISAEDVRLFGEMGRKWFGLKEAEARTKAMEVLCENIFPTTLTSFYRSTLEVEAVCSELLSLHIPDSEAALKARILEGLLFGRHSHSFALTREDMRELGLPLAGDPATEDLAWEVAGELRRSVGGGARATPDDDWIDAVLATREGMRRRRRSPGEMGPSWEAGQIS
jgi:hypothetical protein